MNKKSPPVLIEAKLSRAERRRMLHDPARLNKLVAGSEGVPEYNRLIAYGQVLIFEMSELQQRMQGLHYSKIERKYLWNIQEQITKEWNEHVEKLEAVQERMKEIEDSNKANEKTDRLPTPANDRGRSAKGTQEREHNK